MGPSLRKSLLILLALSPLAPAAHASLPGAADGFFTTSDGVTLHYLEKGHGPLMVFVPGWTMPADIWEGQIGFFSSRYRVVALDPRCQGDSQVTARGLTVRRRAQDIRELLERLGADKAVLVGWSLGGSEVLAYLGLYGPQGLAGVVLADGSPGAEPSPALLQKRRDFIKRLEDNREKETAGFVRWMFHSPPSGATLRRLTALALRMPTDSAVSLLGDMYADEGWRPDYSAIRVPLLYFSSSIDLEKGRWLKRQVPAMRFVEMPRAGHALFVDDPGLFNGETEKFMERIGFAPGTLKAAPP